MLKPGFIDISHHQVIPKSLEAAAQSGIQGVVHKVTEGTTFVDSKVGARYHLTREAGMEWGLYHFVRAGNINAQVNHFLTVSKDVSDEKTMFALDWEVTGLTIN